jgi:hypothetical protein
MRSFSSQYGHLFPVDFLVQNVLQVGIEYPAVDENWPIFARDCRIKWLSLSGFFEPMHRCKAIHLNVQERPPIEVRIIDIVLVPFDVAKLALIAARVADSRSNWLPSV